MSEAVTMPSLTMMTSTVSEESLARDRHTDRQTHTDFCQVYFKLFQSNFEKGEIFRKDLEIMLWVLYMPVCDGFRT